MKLLPAVTVLAGLMAVIAAIFIFHIPLEVLLTWGMGLLCLGWLVIMVTLPWNVYFQARRVLNEIATSRERGIVVPADRDATARTLARRSLLMSISLHLGSAAVMGAITWVSGSTWGWYFAGFYLLSTFFRPGIEYYRFIHARLRSLLEDVTHPRDDVVGMKARINDLEQDREDYRAMMREMRRLQEDLRKDLHDAVDDSTRKDLALDLRITAIARKFEETVDKLTDNQDVIRGVKAFLRLVQENKHAS